MRRLLLAGLIAVSVVSAACGGPTSQVPELTATPPTSTSSTLGTTTDLPGTPTTQGASSTVGASETVEGLPAGASGLKWVMLTSGTTDLETAGVTIDLWRLREGDVPEAPALTVDDAGFGSAFFDSSGEYVAVWYTPMDATGYTGWPELVISDFARTWTVDGVVVGFAWHASEPAIAVITVDLETDKWMLLRSERISDDVAGISLQTVAEVPWDSQLIAWGDWGYMVESWQLTPKGEGEFGEEFDRKQATYLLDESGAPVVGAPVHVEAINAEGDVMLVKGGVTNTLFTEPEEGNLLTFETELIDSDWSGLTATDLRFDPIEPGATAARFLDDYAERIDIAFAFSPDASKVLVMDFSDPDEETLRMPVHVVGLAGDSIDTTSITAPNLGTIGFSRDGRYIVFHDAAAGSIRMLDWENGTEYTVAGVSAPMTFDPELPDVFEMMLDVVLL